MALITFWHYESKYIFFVFTCRTVQAINVIVLLRLFCISENRKQFFFFLCGKICAAVIGSGYECEEDKYIKDTFFVKEK